VNQHWFIYLPVLLLSFALMVPAIIYAEKQAKMKQVFLAAVATMLTNPEFVEKQLTPQGMLPMNNSVDQINALMKSESERMARIVKLSGAKVE
jgi:hypothetical protein